MTRLCVAVVQSLLFKEESGDGVQEGKDNDKMIVIWRIIILATWAALVKAVSTFPK